jgi:hypothetical protein
MELTKVFLGFLSQLWTKKCASRQASENQVIMLSRLTMLVVYFLLYLIPPCALLHFARKRYPILLSRAALY